MNINGGGKMKVGIEPDNALKNKSDVRLYRLDRLEENQRAMLEKMDEITTKLDTHYVNNKESFLKCHQRIGILEARAKKVDKILWLFGTVLVTETVGFIFLLVARKIFNV